MPNQKSYEVSIHPNPTPDEPMPDPAVGGEILEAVGWNKSRYFESQEEALAEAKSIPYPRSPVPGRDSRGDQKSGFP